MKIEDWPFKIATNNKELSKIIEKYNSKDNEKELKNFYDKIGMTKNRNGAKEVVYIINKVMGFEHNED